MWRQKWKSGFVSAEDNDFVYEFMNFIKINIEDQILYQFKILLQQLLLLFM